MTVTCVPPVNGAAATERSLVTEGPSSAPHLDVGRRDRVGRGRAVGRIRRDRGRARRVDAGGCRDGAECAHAHDRRGAAQGDRATERRTGRAAVAQALGAVARPRALHRLLGFARGLLGRLLARRDRFGLASAPRELGDRLGARPPRSARRWHARPGARLGLDRCGLGRGILGSRHPARTGSTTRRLGRVDR